MTNEESCAEESPAEKKSQLMKLIALGTLRRGGSPERDLSRATDAELLSIIGATEGEFDEAVRGFAAARARGEYADLFPAREVRA